MKIKLKKILLSSEICIRNEIPFTITPISNYTIEEMAEVFLDAYKDTLDYDGESINETNNEIGNIIRGDYGEIITSASGCIKIKEKLASIIFITKKSLNEELDMISFIPYIVTKKEVIRQGFAKALIINGLQQLIKSNYKICELSVSEGNKHAYELYISLGFEHFN